MASPPEADVPTQDEQGADDGVGQRRLKWQSKQNTATTYVAWSASPLFALRCVFLLLRATGSDDS